MEEWQPHYNSPRYLLVKGRSISALKMYQSHVIEDVESGEAWVHLWTFCLSPHIEAPFPGVLTTKLWKSRAQSLHQSQRISYQFRVSLNSMWSVLSWCLATAQSHRTNETCVLQLLLWEDCNSMYTIHYSIDFAWCCTWLQLIPRQLLCSWFTEYSRNIGLLH